jgi:hypothetical protein
MPVLGRGAEEGGEVAQPKRTGLGAAAAIGDLVDNAPHAHEVLTRRLAPLGSDDRASDVVHQPGAPSSVE